MATRRITAIFFSLTSAPFKLGSRSRSWRLGMLNNNSFTREHLAIQIIDSIISISSILKLHKAIAIL